MCEEIKLLKTAFLSSEMLGSKCLFTAFLLAFICQTSTAPCGVCECFYRTGYINCSHQDVNEVGETMNTEDFGWAMVINMCALVGKLNMKFYSSKHFPDLLEVDVTGKKR